MLRRFLAPIALAVTLGIVALAGPPPQMRIDEVRPGMVGIGRTVFGGTRVEEFRVNVLGVLENVIGPHRNLILARLEGGPLASTGVIAGMSGSPVYIDGRLVGAVSYALGQFSKEPIAGITPIDEMTGTGGAWKTASGSPSTLLTEYAGRYRRTCRSSHGSRRLTGWKEDGIRSRL